jgi:hypothetical protein
MSNPGPDGPLCLSEIKQAHTDDGARTNLFNGPKANSADDANNQNPNQE